MSQVVVIQLEVTNDRARLRLRRAVDMHLQELLNRQDSGERLTATERKEAEGLVNLAELLSLLRLRIQRASKRWSK